MVGNESKNENDKLVHLGFYLFKELKYYALLRSDPQLLGKLSVPKIT